MCVRIFAIATVLTVGASAVHSQQSYDCAEPANRTLQLCIDACEEDENYDRQACVAVRAANASGSNSLGLPPVGTGAQVTNFAPFILPGVLVLGAAGALMGGGSTTSTTPAN